MHCSVSCEAHVNSCQMLKNEVVPNVNILECFLFHALISQSEVNGSNLGDTNLSMQTSSRGTALCKYPRQQQQAVQYKKACAPELANFQPAAFVSTLSLPTHLLLMPLPSLCVIRVL